ncbi:MAG: hypothetical protein HKN42_00015 [Granulosicoccus sp.]|nr:hypothetical protein [Granulosicoccus sp.]
MKTRDNPSDIDDKRRQRVAPYPVVTSLRACACLCLLAAGHSTSTAQATPIAAMSTACGTGCRQVIDYRSLHSPLVFSRVSTRSGAADDNLPRSWRHRYEVRLTREGTDRIVFDQLGNRYRFSARPDGSYRSQNRAGGTLELLQDHYHWTDGQRRTYEFRGSYPTRITDADGQSLSLEYRHGRLQSISDDFNEKIVLDHLPGNSTRVILPDGRRFEYPDQACQPRPIAAGDDPPESCDTARHPANGFDRVQTGPGVFLLDARPASCQSYFVEYYGTERGTRIEAGIALLPPYSSMTATIRSFPIIDFIDGSELVVVRSRDLASSSFNDPASPQALYQRLLRDARQVHSGFLEPLATDGFVSASELGRVTRITHAAGQSVSLHLLIRHGMASTGHWQQIVQARTELAERYGIRLQVVIIP